MRGAGAIKASANQAYDAGDFAGALSLYTQVRGLSRSQLRRTRRDGTDRATHGGRPQALQADGAASLKHVLYSNRSAAHLALGDAHQALADASVRHARFATRLRSHLALGPTVCRSNPPGPILLVQTPSPSRRGSAPRGLVQVAVQSKPGWAKAFSRRAVAQMKLKDFAAAAESSLRAYELEGKDHHLTQLVDALMCVFRGVHLVQPGMRPRPTCAWHLTASRVALWRDPHSSSTLTLRAA